MTTREKTALSAGLWYLAMAALYSFSMIYADSRFYLPGDPATTIARIASSGWLFRAGVASCLAGHVCFLMLASALYGLFRPVHGGLARAMLLFVVAGVAAAYLARLFQLAPLILLGRIEGLSRFSPAQARELSLLFLDLHRQGGLMVTVFWALWLLPLGLLFIRSGFAPRLLGAIALAACACYLADFALGFLYPAALLPLDAPLSVVETVAELSIILWLLARGPRLDRGLSHAAEGGGR